MITLLNPIFTAIGMIVFGWIVIKAIIKRIC